MVNRERIWKKEKESNIELEKESERIIHLKNARETERGREKEDDRNLKKKG